MRNSQQGFEGTIFVDVEEILPFLCSAKKGVKIEDFKEHTSCEEGIHCWFLYAKLLLYALVFEGTHCPFKNQRIGFFLCPMRSQAAHTASAALIEDFCVLKSKIFVC